MRMTIYLALSCSLFMCQSCAQPLTKEELASRDAADYVISKHFKDKVKNKDYIVFSVGDAQFIILTKNQNTYLEYYFDKSREETVVLDTLFQNDTEVFKRMFDKSSYHKDYISFGSDFYKNGYEISSGNITYFSYVTRHGKRYGESRLSFFIKPIPIEPDIYFYFTERILKYARTS